MIRKLLIGLLGVIVISAGGCGQKAVSRRGQVVYLEGARYETAFQAGMDAMRANFAIQRADPQSGEIIGQPTVYSAEQANERFSTGLGESQVEMRRKASLQLAKRPDGCAAEIWVDIERRDTYDYQVYEGILATEDLRMRTPAERRDLAGPEQRDVWTFIRRDRAGEELIIRGLRERLELLESIGDKPSGKSDK